MSTLPNFGANPPSIVPTLLNFGAKPRPIRPTWPKIEPIPLYPWATGVARKALGLAFGVDVDIYARVQSNI